MPAIHLRNWPESAWSYIIEEFEPSNSKITADTDQDFGYHFTVRYIPGVSNQLADCLSGLSCQKDNVKLPKLHIHQITSQFNARSDSLNDIRVATQEDDELALLKHTIMHGWPSSIREVPSEIQPYWTFREELTVEDGIVLKGTHIVIPHMKCHATLQLIHKGHLGIGKCKI